MKNIITKAIYKRKHLIGSLLIVSDDESLIITVESRAGGRQAWEAVTKSLHLSDTLTGSRERMGLGWVCVTS